MHITAVTQYCLQAYVAWVQVDRHRAEVQPHLASTWWVLWLD